jgi:hypothetical protein
MKLFVKASPPPHHVPAVTAKWAPVVGLLPVLWLLRTRAYQSETGVTPSSILRPQSQQTPPPLDGRVIRPVYKFERAILVLLVLHTVKSEPSIC